VVVHRGTVRPSIYLNGFNPKLQIRVVIVIDNIGEDSPDTRQGKRAMSATDLGESFQWNGKT